MKNVLVGLIAVIGFVCMTSEADAQLLSRRRAPQVVNNINLGGGVPVQQIKVQEIRVQNFKAAPVRSYHAPAPIVLRQQKVHYQQYAQPVVQYVQQPVVQYVQQPVIQQQSYCQAVQAQQYSSGCSQLFYAR